MPNRILNLQHRGISRAGIIDDTRASNGWHTDIPFEAVPADFSILKMRTVPEGELIQNPIADGSKIITIV
jgi:alpha-ketoglutarate-dependent taurine dioxygenase